MEALYDMGRYTGLFPLKDQSKEFRRDVLNIMLIVYVAVGIVWFGVTVLMNPKATGFDMADAIYSMETKCSMIFFYMITIYKRQYALEVLNHISDFTIFGEPNTLKKSVTCTKNIFRMIIGYAIVAPTVLCFTNLATYNSCMKSHKNADDIQYCGYVFGIHYPYNFDKGVFFIIHLVISCYSFVFLSVASLTLVAYVSCAARCLVLKIDHLNRMLSEVLNHDDVERREYLKNCIKYHNHIISLVDELNELHSINNAPAVFMYSAIIGVCLFSLTIEYSMKAALIALGFTGAAFSINFSGQMIFERSQTVSDAAYNMDWYNANACMAKDIKFIIMRSQVPLSYRAGPFGTMSFVFFGTILRGAYTYMTMQTDLKEK